MALKPMPTMVLPTTQLAECAAPDLRKLPSKPAHLITPLSPMQLANPFASLLRAELFEHRIEHAALEQIERNWSPEAMEALRILERGENLVLVGRAGSGKTTLVMYWLVGRLLRGGFAPMFQHSATYYKEMRCDPEHTRLLRNSPAFLACSLAHKVVARMMSELPPLYQYKASNGTLYDVHVWQNVMTAHRALQYRPVRDVVEEEDGSSSTSMRFRPHRGRDNNLKEIQVVYIDESGQTDVSGILRPLMEACPDAQFILTGDLGQLGAVAGVSALGAALPYTNAIELQAIYRNRGDVLEFADMIRDGKPFPLRRGGPIQWFGTEKRVRFRTYPTQDMPYDDYPPSAANEYCAQVLFTLIKAGQFTLGVDFALCPQFPKGVKDDEYDPSGANDKFGINAIWRILAEKLDMHYGRHTYYISTQSGPRILAAGDTYYVTTSLGGQEEYMVMGFAENPKFVANHGKPPALYNTRDPAIWLHYLQQDQVAGGDTFDFDMGDLGWDNGDDGWFEDQAVNRLLSQDDKDNISESRSQWNVILCNITQLRTFITARLRNPQDVYDLLRYVVAELHQCALAIDYACNVSAAPLSVRQIHEQVEQVFANVHLSGYLDDADASDPVIRDITRTSSIAQMLPSITTIHKSQGSESEKVVLLTHHKARNAGNESLYTGFTRAKQEVLVVCSADTFGAPLLADGTPDKHSAKLRKPAIEKRQVAGITLEDKRAAFRKRLEDPSASNDTREIGLWAKQTFGGK